jgi:hypothetical protein
MCKNNTHLSRANQSLANNIVLIDGFSKSGKSVIAPIFGYLDRSEQWQIDFMFEYLSALKHIDGISDESYKAMLCTSADMLLYNLRVGRYVNFRNTDNTSPYNDGLYERYLSRTKKKDGDIITNEINNINPILPIHLHFIFGHSDALYRGFGDRLKLWLIVFRDPAYLIDSWHEKGWVNKICKLERSFQLCCDYNGRNIPWFAIKYADEYIGASRLEKAILTIYYWYMGVFFNYNNLSELQKDKTIIVVFEKYIKDPNKYIDTICNILNTERSSDFDKIMQRLSLPRDSCSSSNSFSFKDFLEKYEKEISNKYIKIIKKLDKDYKEFVNNLVIND